MFKIVTSKKEEEDRKLIKEMENAGIELKIDYDELKKENKKLKAEKDKVVDLFNRLEKQKNKEVYVEIKSFNESEELYLEEVWRIGSSESFKFMMHKIIKELTSELEAVKLELKEVRDGNNAG